MAEKSYRIRANVGKEQVIKTCLTQDIDFLEVLSLKINQMDTYKLHVSNYGIIVGRILANDGFGVPNAKVSVFLKLSDEDAERSDIVNFYPYKSITNNDKNNKRYNLLPDSSNDDCYKVVGTFPSKRLVLDNDTEIEIYEKYWKYTTVTNQSGDYMIFGVPTGNQTVHVDIDLSDIGILSQKPRDFFYKGYNKEQFDSAEQFKDANELDNLTQLLSQNSSIYVYPFFGDKNQNEIAITRCDINVSYKFEPTCVFIGSIISDRQGQHIGHKCGPSRHIGHNSNLVTGEGTIEMIRKTPDGLIEEFPIKANRLIDGDGVWCYQIPMNLDYICTDEFGNIIPTQDSRKGIPTRTSVRFRISLLETKGAPSAEHVAKHLVPSVHELDPQLNEPHILNGSLYDNCYEFGSATPDEFFRDLLWNKVYSVKNYIPRIDYGEDTSRYYTGIRSVNDLNNKNNVFPFNSARLRLKFSYQLLCTIMSIVIDVVGFYNKMVTEIVCFKLEATFKILGKRVKISFGKPLSFLSQFIKCIGFKGNYFFEEESNIYYFPRCDKNCGDGMMESGDLTPITNINTLKDRIQQALALEYDVVNLDFYNDWINGTLYFPLWFWRKRAKKKYFFGLFSSRAKNTFCSCNNVYNGLSLSQSCSSQYDESFKPIFSEDSDYWHRTFGRRFINYGLIKEFTNRDGLNIYYYSPGAPNDNGYKTSTKSTKFTQLFATDIILLGSLNNCDLDNLPKTFDSLPSSTVNLPFIATFNNNESGDGVVSGLDWGHNGKDMKIAYQDGLLIDLNCWTVHTKYKSCVNLSRLSELNVTFDMDITTDDNNEPNIIHDGLITDKELLDHEVRAKFASLNHNGLTTLVKNPTTNYDTYKFHYIYPVNFDGHLGNMYRNTINSDISDSNYIMYRLGEGKDSTSKTPLRHKKHFYNGTEKKFNFPLYNNSFYFYFGLNEGNTAIDKFNSEFNSLCAKRNMYSFSINHKTKPGKWCYDDNKITTDFGTIDIEFNGLTDIFSYTLYNDFNEVVISEENVNNHDLRFGYAIAEGGGSYIMTNDGYKKDGRIIEFNTGNIVTNSFGEPKFLENGVYYLEVVNSFGLKVTQKITMTQNVLTPNFEEIRLGTKFKENIMTSQDICGEMNFHGELKLKSFIIDGEEVYIANVDNYFIDGLTHYYVINEVNIYPNNEGAIEYNGEIYEETYDEEGKNFYITIDDNKIEALNYEKPKEITCKVTCTDGSQIYLIIEPENDETQDISNFVCYGVGSVPSITKTIQGNINGQDIYTLIFNIWRPGDYIITANQICNNIMNDNVSVNTFSIENGENFIAYINDVPLTVINNDYFKGEKIVYAEDTNMMINDSFPRVWLQLENPLIYDFKTTKLNDIGYWDDFCNIIVLTSENDNGEKNNYISPLSKIEILSNQLKIISEMRNLAYVSQKQGNQLTLTSKGGKEPILIRNIHPLYSVFDENTNICDDIIIENNNSLELPIGFPLIIDENYQNEVYETKNIGLNYVNYPNIYNKLGNYFGAFTNNGGLIILNNGKNVIDTSLYSQSLPEGIDVLSNYSLITNQIIKSYPQKIFNDINKYLRLLSIDKRIKINGDYYLPVSCKYTVYNDNNNDNWTNGNLQLKLYNVAPLVYDDYYNIIGENLSYEIKKVSEEIYEETITIESINDDVNKVKLTIPNNSYFYGCGEGFSNINQISSETNFNLLVKLRSICDTIATDINFDNLEEPTKIIFKKLENIDSDNEFNSDSDIRLVSNLMWYSDLCDVSSKKQHLRRYGRLHTCRYNIDGNEYDIRDKYDNYLYSSENYKENNNISFSISKEGNISTPYGHSFTIEASNCNMIGTLEYEEEQNENGLKYNFKSFIESDEVNKKEMTIDNRININSAVLFFTPKKYGKYAMLNNYKIYEKNIESNELLVLHTYYKNDKYNVIYGESECNIELLSITNSISLTFKIDGEDRKYDGYIWSKNTIIYEINDLTSDFVIDDNINLSYEELKNRFNKYGIPVYSKIYKIGDVNFVKITFDPHIDGKIITDSDIRIYNFNIEDGINEFLCKFKYPNENIYCWMLTQYVYYFSGTLNYHTNNNNLLFYQAREYTPKILPIKVGINATSTTINQISSKIVSTSGNCYYVSGGTLQYTNSSNTNKNIIDGEIYIKVNGEFKKLYRYYKSDDGKYYHNYKGNVEITEIKGTDSNSGNTHQFISEKVLDNNNIEIKYRNEYDINHTKQIDNNILKINNKCVIGLDMSDNLSDNDYTLEDKFNKYTINSIEDFSCTIYKDEFGDNYDFITAYSPFLSYGVKKQYGMKMELSSINHNKQTILIDSFVNNKNYANLTIPKSNINFLTKKYAFFEDNCYPFKSNSIDVNRKILDLSEYDDDNYSHNGTINVKNYINENINVNMVSYNSSIANFINGFDDSEDIKKIRTYKKDTVIGEMYPYINKNFYTLNGYNSYNNLIGCTYGNYYALDFKHPILDDETYSVMNVSVYQPTSKIITDTETSEVEIDEINEFYDDLLYVFQPNSSSHIDENVEIITCNYVKSYESNSKNFNREVINQYSQNVLFHVGPLYFGKSIKQGNKYYLPCIILDKNMNEDITNIFNKKSFNYYFNNKGYSFANVKRFDKGLKYYQIDCTDGYSNYYSIDDIIRCVMIDKTLSDISIEELIINPIGIKLYHFEKVDGDFYDFVSTIEDIKEITEIYYLEVDLPTTITENLNLVLTIQIDNNIFYKFPFYVCKDDGEDNYKIKTGFL